MKRCLLFFMIAFMGFSLSLSAKQKFICHTSKTPEQIPYKVDALNGKYVIHPLDKLSSNSDTCPEFINIEDKDPEGKIHTLKLLFSSNKRCYYKIDENSDGDDNTQSVDREEGTEVINSIDDVMCMFTYVPE